MLNPELEEASYRFFDNIFSQGLGIKDVLLSTTGFYWPGDGQAVRVARAGERVHAGRSGSETRRLLLAGSVLDGQRVQRGPETRFCVARR